MSETERLVEFELQAGDLAMLTRDEQAFNAAICHAVTELNVLMRLYVLSNPVPGGGKAIDAIANCQSFTLLRCWSSKIYDSFKLFFECDQATLDSTELRDLTNTWRPILKSLYDEPGREINRVIRNKIASHYIFEEARKQVQSADPGYDATYYLHNLDGNSCYPIGDAIMFVEKLRAYCKDSNFDGGVADLIDLWLDWALRVSATLRGFHSDFFGAVIHPRLPEKVGHEKEYAVESSHISGLSGSSLPLFIRKEEECTD